MKKRICLAVTLTLLTVVFFACGSSKFVSTWKAPDVQPGNFKGQKVATFVVTLQKSVRLGAEDSLARELKQRGVEGIAGHTLVPDEVLKDRDKSKEILEKAGISGAVVMRVTGRDKNVYSTPGTMWYTGAYYPSFWGYWGYGWSAVYQPGSVNTETVVSIETLVYSVKQDKLLWAGMSQTTNPQGISKTIAELVKLASKEMQKSGLISSN